MTFPFKFVFLFHITAEPDVICKDITKDHEFVVIACDGIWDVLSNQDVVEFVRDKLAQKIEPEMVCYWLTVMYGRLLL